ncbi:MAG: peptide deformylase [Nocardioidaceae bacterium]
MSDLPAGGTPRPMTRWGTPVLHALCRPVGSFDAELAALVADMVATMYAADGVGLAANQVGVGLRVFVFDCQDDDGAHHRGVVCNPTLVVPEGRNRVLDESAEGCLSLPGAFAPLARPDVASVSGVDHHGEPVEFSGSGIVARCLQHEADHLEGLVFADRLSARVRRSLHKEAERLADGYPPGWPVASADGAV